MFKRRFEPFNAAVQWTAASRRLDGGSTMICFPPGSKCSESPRVHQKMQVPCKGTCIFYMLERGFEPSNAAVRWTAAGCRSDGGNYFFLHLHSRRYPQMHKPTTAAVKPSSRRTLNQIVLPVTKIAVGPSAPPIIPTVLAMFGIFA